MIRNVPLYPWMWRKHHLTSTERTVLGCTNGFNVPKNATIRGYKGSMRQMARDLDLDDRGVTRALHKLQNMGLVVLENGIYRCAEYIRSDAENIRRGAENIRKSAENIRSPHTPLYNRSQKIDNNIQSKPKAMDGDAGLGGTAIDSFSLALFTEYYRLFPYRAKNDRIKQAAQTEFCSLSPEKQQLIIDTLRQQIDNDEKISDTSPLMYIRHFDKNAPPPEGEPVNYNNGSIPEGKFVQPAKYKGQWGMYCLADILKFNLETKQEQ